jgi:hypothetical protein
MGESVALLLAGAAERRVCQICSATSCRTSLRLAHIEIIDPFEAERDPLIDSEIDIPAPAAVAP